MVYVCEECGALASEWDRVRHLPFCPAASEAGRVMIARVRSQGSREDLAVQVMDQERNDRRARRGSAS